VPAIKILQKTGESVTLRRVLGGSYTEVPGPAAWETAVGISTAEVAAKSCSTC